MNPLMTRATLKRAKTVTWTSRTQMVMRVSFRDTARIRFWKLRDTIPNHAFRPSPLAPRHDATPERPAGSTTRLEDDETRGPVRRAAVVVARRTGIPSSCRVCILAPCFPRTCRRRRPDPQGGGARPPVISTFIMPTAGLTAAAAVATRMLPRQPEDWDPYCSPTSCPPPNPSNSCSCPNRPGRHTRVPRIYEVPRPCRHRPRPPPPICNNNQVSRRVIIIITTSQKERRPEPLPKALVPPREQEQQEPRRALEAIFENLRPAP